MADRPSRQRAEQQGNEPAKDAQAAPAEQPPTNEQPQATANAGEKSDTPPAESPTAAGKGAKNANDDAQARYHEQIVNEVLRTMIQPGQPPQSVIPRAEEFARALVATAPEGAGALEFKRAAIALARIMNVSHVPEEISRQAWQWIAA